MNAISYCLFGTGQEYLVGAVENARLIRTFYPDWKGVFWVEKGVSESVCEKIRGFGSMVVRYSKVSIPNGMFARFFINDDPSIERFLIRDVDSRPCQREVNAVNAWIKSGKNFHVIRDHPYHGVVMMGGLWGARAGAISGLESQARKFRRFNVPYTREKAYGADQEFLSERVWPLAKRNMLCHDSCTRDKFQDGVNFPDGTVLRDWRFCGEVFNEKNEPNPHHWTQRINWMGA